MCIKDLVNGWVAELRRKHRYLLQVNANERSITHKLAEIIQAHYGSSYDVDCEYNREDHAPKKLAGLSRASSNDDEDANTIFPDIIVHRRGCQNNNHIIFEIKKKTNRENRTTDFEKLRLSQNQLGYVNIVFIDLDMQEENDEIRVNEEIPKI